MSAWPSAHQPQPCPSCGRIYKTLPGVQAHFRQFPEHKTQPEVKS